MPKTLRRQVLHCFANRASVHPALFKQLRSTRLQLLSVFISSIHSILSRVVVCVLDLRSRSQLPPRGEQYWPRSEVRAGNETIGSLVPKRALDVIEGLGTRLLIW